MNVSRHKIYKFRHYIVRRKHVPFLNYRNKKFASHRCVHRSVDVFQLSIVISNYAKLYPNLHREQNSSYTAIATPRKPIRLTNDSEKAAAAHRHRQPHSQKHSDQKSPPITAISRDSQIRNNSPAAMAGLKRFALHVRALALDTKARNWN